MSSKVENEKLKLIQNKCQTILGNLLREEDNKYCVDCDAKGPRWASWNLGIFLCIRCAGIHRNLGVHISKVKSVNLDTWTPEQVACLQQMGNSQARAVYEANLPEGFRRPQIDPSLEAFIRAKYEQKKYIAKEWVPPPPPKPAFDIEDEKKKEKEKKKKSKSGPGFEIPLSSTIYLPSAVPRRPHNSGSVSPSIKALKEEQSKTIVSEVPGSTDLLNLGDCDGNSGDDIFDAFLSAPTTTVQENGSSLIAPTLQNISSSDSVSQTNVSVDEADFFNQKIDGNSLQSNKMTKESILSLYGSNVCQVPPAHSVPPVYGISGGMYVSQTTFRQVAVGGYSTLPNPPINTSTMFNSYGSSSIMQDTRQPPNSWIGIPGGTIDSLQIAQGLGQMSQQMANLQLTGQTWSVTGNMTANSGGLVVGANQPGPGMVWPASSCSTNQNISNNFWK